MCPNILEFHDFSPYLGFQNFVFSLSCSTNRLIPVIVSNGLLVKLHRPNDSGANLTSSSLSVRQIVIFGTSCSSDVITGILRLVE